MPDDPLDLLRIENARLEMALRAKDEEIRELHGKLRAEASTTYALRISIDMLWMRLRQPRPLPGKAKQLTRESSLYLLCEENHQLLEDMSGGT